MHHTSIGKLTGIAMEETSFSRAMIVVINCRDLNFFLRPTNFFRNPNQVRTKGVPSQSQSKAGSARSGMMGHARCGQRGWAAAAILGVALQAVCVCAMQRIESAPRCRFFTLCVLPLHVPSPRAVRLDGIRECSILKSTCGSTEIITTHIST